MAQTHAVKIFRGRPDIGTPLLTTNFSLTVVDTGQNNSSPITGVTVAPNPPTLGGLFAITLTGSSGVIGGANTINFTPAVYTNWDAASYQLVGSYIVASGGNTGTFSNRLFVTFGSSAATSFTNTYWFRSVAVVGSNSISPLFSQSGGGGNYNHAPAPSPGSVQPVQPAMNTTLLSSFASVSQLYTNETVTFTVRFTNSSAVAVSLDSVVDTLPPAFAYVIGSSKFNGIGIANPATNSQLLTWSERYDVPGNSIRDFTFQAIPSTNGFATNAVVAYSQATVIDTTASTADNVPATAIVRVLLEPTAVNDSGSVLEDTTLNVAATGVLANDIEPNGFAISVVSFTQPARGTVTVTNNGGYSYRAATNYFGTDSFTYTFTNGNARAATATVNLTVTSVNDAPTLSAISNVTTNEDSGLQTVNLTGITVGPTNEVGQLLTVTATSSNPALIPNPTVSYTSPNGTGALTFASVTNNFGSATITVIVRDDGGTTNGGVDSVTNLFLVTINPVNDAPTLSAISNVLINEVAGLQTVSLAGITVGPTNEAGQTLTVTAASGNTALIPNPTVNYTSPNATGTLTFTPVTGALGTTTVTVIVRDSGGTTNGGVDSVTNFFSVTVLAVTNIWNPGGSFTVNVSNATGAAGSGYTQTNYTGYLDILALTTNPFTIQLTTPAPAANFNNDSNYVWTIATTTRGVLDFDPTKFSVNSGAFSNDLAGGTFSVTTNGSNVVVVFSPNHAPVANPLFLGRAWGTAMRISIPFVLTNFTSDLDGDVTLFSGAGGSTNGTPITTNAIFILFPPTNNLAETFPYRIRDNRVYRPGDTVRLATNWITVSLTNAVGLVVPVSSSGGSLTLSFAGIPGYAYDVERSTNLTVWTAVLTTNAPTRGVWLYTDSNPPQPSAYYRMRQH